MGLFTRKGVQNQKQSQEAILSGSVAEPPRSWFTRHLRGKSKRAGGSSQAGEPPSEDGLIGSAVNSRPPSSRGDRPTNQSLWDRAYDALREEKWRLVEEYEELLIKGTQEMSSRSSQALVSWVLTAL